MVIVDDTRHSNIYFSVLNEIVEVPPQMQEVIHKWRHVFFSGFPLDFNLPFRIIDDVDFMETLKKRDVIPG